MAQAKVIEVIQVKSLRGKGTEKCSIRRVIQYFTFTGVLLSEYDPSPCNHIHHPQEAEQEDQS